MIKRLRIWIIGLFGLLAAATAASEIWPERAAKLMLSALYQSAGLQKKTVETSFGPVHYLEGGAGETVVFFHGIYALKEHWIDLSRQISGDYHVILLDLPGFGENPRLDAAQYDYVRQSTNTLEALDALKIAQFHAVANSMGAQVALQIATEQPNRVQSLAFIGSPVGVHSPEQSDMERAVAAGQSPLVVTTEAEYADRMAWLFPKEPFIPRPIARFWSKSEVGFAKINETIWQAVASSQTSTVEERATQFSHPALIIWCKEDRIFHVSGAEVLDAALPNSTLETPENCGHLPMLDRPKSTGKELLSFLKETR